MDKNLEPQTLPPWNCRLKLNKKLPINVGDISDLVCLGFKEVPTGGRYAISLDKKYKYALNILSVGKDTSTEKTFKVTTYIPLDGDLPFKVTRNGEEIFSSTVKGIKVESVIKNKNEAKPIPPVGAYYLWPAATDLIGGGVIFIGMMLIAINTLLKKNKLKQEFLRVTSKARYADPFMDFNVEMRAFIKEKKSSVLFLKLLEETFQKLFFRIFQNNASFANMNLLVKSMRGLGMQSHEIRSFKVLEEDFKQFKKLYEAERGKVTDQKKDFLEHSMRTINKIKKYLEANN